MRPLVLFSISNGWGIRNYVHTGIISAVAEFADVAIASSPSQMEFFKTPEAAKIITTLIELPADEAPFWRLVRRAKKGILQARHRISTAYIKSARSTKNPLLRALKRAGWALAGLCAAPWQIAAIERFERHFKITPLPELPRRPSVFINCEPFDNRDIQLQRTMHRFGIPSIAIIPSWDNPSTKGCILNDAATILVWGEHQKAELLNFYPALSPEQIKISGIPQFDAYAAPLPAELTRGRFLRGLGIGEGQRVILYATDSEQLFPSEPLVVADIAQAIAAGRFRDDVHLLIRCHPADRAERYAHLSIPGKVTVFPSSRKRSHVLAQWIPPHNEINILVATLRYCDMCITAASTMTLDAFMCSKPVISIGYNGEPAAYYDSVRRFYDYYHLKPIALSGATPIVESRSALIHEIERALADPKIYEPARQAVVERFCQPPAQGSISYIVSEIRSYCHGSELSAGKSVEPGVRQDRFDGSAVLS